MRALLVALILVAAPAAAGPGEVEVPVDCGRTVCVLPKAVWLAIVASHNEAVEEAARLKEQLGGKARKCPGDRET